MYSKLHFIVNQFVSLSNDEKVILEQAFTVKQIPKNTVLVSEGEVSTELYFINYGLLRLYYNKDGEHITAYIFRENLFASCYESFLQSIPSNQYLEALEACELLSINKEKLEELYTKLPQINVLTRKIAEQRFINGQSILSSFLLDNVETRYLKFVEKNSDLFLRIPHHIIASYLGITPVSLSRLRKRTLRNKS